MCWWLFIGGFKAIAECMGLKLKIPNGCWFSFFNSPYPSHKSSSAIDIYYPEGEGLMPIDDGVVLEVEKFECPVRRTDASPFDYLTLIRVGEDVVLKILHVKPNVKPGEKLHLGDPIGKIIVSGFLSPWSNIHMHLEFRSLHDPYRALGGFRIDIRETVNLLPKPSQIVNPFTIEEICENYMWLKPKMRFNFQCGLMLMVNDKLLWVDGGIPHYNYGAILGFNGLGSIRYVDGVSLGEIYFHTHPYSLFKPKCKVYVDGLMVKGLGSYIGNPLLKVIFDRNVNGYADWRIGDQVELSFK